tara:strand:- start:124 stop:810 length:687 start_codon:yes stop_codon:yes gene_type:complete
MNWYKIANSDAKRREIQLYWFGQAYGILRSFEVSQTFYRGLSEEELLNYANGGDIQPGQDFALDFVYSLSYTNKLSIAADIPLYKLAEIKQALNVPSAESGTEYSGIPYLYDLISNIYDDHRRIAKILIDAYKSEWQGYDEFEFKTLKDDYDWTTIEDYYNDDMYIPEDPETVLAEPLSEDHIQFVYDKELDRKYPWSEYKQMLLQPEQTEQTGQTEQTERGEIDELV